MHRYVWFVAAASFFYIFLSPVFADNRVALVIGNGAYAHAPHLPNPTHDAEGVAAALRRIGFDTILGVDLDQNGMQDATIRFSRVARAADIAVFYYSGHALQVAGVNYLVPVDIQLHDEGDLRRMTKLDEVVADVHQAKTLRILVLDSCRDNPLAEELKRSIGTTRSTSIGRGLAKIDSPEGMIVAYATQAGRTADDGSGYNSPYTAAFLKNIEGKEEIGTIFRRISSDVYATTKQAQLPELSLSLIGEFYLNGRLEIKVTPSAATPADPCVNASEHWRSSEALGSLFGYEDHVARFPNCSFSGLAKGRIEALKSKATVSAPSLPPAPFQNDEANGFSAWLSNANYQNLFDDMKSKHWYPSIVEGRSSDGERQFRARFVPQGKLTRFWSHHGITNDMFKQQDAMLRQKGFVLISRQTFRDDVGDAVQATWVLK